MTIKQRAKRIKMLILDVDGVMTNGRIIYDSRGNELKCFNVQDGMGLALLAGAGIKLALISAKGSPALLRRARDIGAAEVKQNAIDKLSALEQILKKYKLSNKNICFIGDDLLDLPAMKQAGLAVAVANARPEVKKKAHYITRQEGGKGAIREVIEIILQAQNSWYKLIKQYLAFVVCALMFVLNSGCAQKESVQAKAVSDKSTAAEEELAQAPDEMLSSFSISGYSKGGKKQWDLEGTSADIMTEIIELTNVTSRVYGKETKMTIVADKGSLNRIDNNVHLEDNVLASTDEGATLSADYLDWDAQNEKLTSDSPVRITRGGMKANGKGLIGQPLLNLVQLKKDVTVNISLDPASSQTAPTTVITCDGPLEVAYEKNLAVFQDNVKVKDKRGEIFADKMDVYFSTQSDTDKPIDGMAGMGIDKVVALGNVEIHQGGNSTYSQKAVYDAETGKLILTGQPKLVIYSTESLKQMTDKP